MIDIATRAQHAGALQKPGELAQLLAGAAAVDPRVIVEIGSDRGGTLFAWRAAFPAAAVFAISLQSGPYSTGAALESHGAEVLSLDSHDRWTMVELASRLNGRLVDVLFIDGDHTYEGVSSDFYLYAPLVRPGGLVCLHDICHHPTMPDVGVDRFWCELGGRKREIIEHPDNWGGIGILEKE